KTFRAPRMKQRKIAGTEVIGEIKAGERLILELHARSGMRIGEVPSLRASDVNGRRLTIRRPKSGRDEESAFMPETLAGRLKACLESQNVLPDQKFFPVRYPTARSLVKRLGQNEREDQTARLEATPSHLREPERDAPRGYLQSILRHQKIKITRMYLVRISAAEALRWIDVLHGK
ncbi:MAG: tyrosine-type recombinase/integrase, partial [Syntrophorhabdales bacterium]